MNTIDDFDRHVEVADDLLRKGLPREAMKSIRAAQQELCNLLKTDPLRLATVACLLVDTGTDLGTSDVVREGLGIFNKHSDEIAEEISAATLEYNLGNAKKSLYDIDRQQSQNRFTPGSIELLTEAKDHFWRALKDIGDAAAEPQLLVNLATTLYQCGRVAEALSWYGRALKIDPTFGMAHLNRGQALLFLHRVSDTFTIKLLRDARKSFQLAETSGHLPAHLETIAREQRERLDEDLLRKGWNDDRTGTDEAQSHAEYEEHDQYWRFCLSNNLALCEHALYCHCAGSRRDDISILKQPGPIGGDFVPRLELLLNRIKSEFCLARALYFQSAAPTDSWPTHSFEGTFTELYDSEVIGIQAEYLRTSFRLCFGILDRIAHGLNELFSFAQASEPLYFESFWRPRDQKIKGEEERWDILNKQDNMPLVALYSLAQDLNQAAGQWGFFKKIRNDLEHGLLVLLPDDQSRLPTRVEPERIAFQSLPVATFRRQTLDMLQFTASAVFSFAFCVRTEGLRQTQDSVVSVEFSKKNVGKE